MHKTLCALINDLLIWCTYMHISFSFCRCVHVHLNQIQLQGTSYRKNPFQLG